MGVGKAGAQDALVPGPDEALGIFGEVDDRKEMRGQIAVAFLQREVFLVIAHDGDQDLVGEAEKCGVEGTLDYRRIFVQVGHELQEVGVLVESVAASLGVGGQFPFDLFAALAGRTMTPLAWSFFS